MAIRIGDTYVKSEWRLHQNVKNPNQVSKFLREWNNYFKTMEQSELQQIESPLKPNSLNKDQKKQLEKLKEELQTKST